MNKIVGGSMDRVVREMYDRLGEELTVADLARTARYSKFYFSRMFRQLTGVSPARFRSVLRFQEARRLLATTSLEVAEISNRVGYGSIGTFGTRFKQAVGVTPTEFRQQRGKLVAHTMIAGDERTVPGSSSGGVVRGRVAAVSPAIEPGAVFVGLFADRVPRRPPVSIAEVSGSGPFLLPAVPPGTWYVHADGVILDRPAADSAPPGGQAGLVGRGGPLSVVSGGVVDVEVRLREMRPVDLPLLATPFIVRPRPLAMLAGIG